VDAYVEQGSPQCSRGHDDKVKRPKVGQHPGSMPAPPMSPTPPPKPKPQGAGGGRVVLMAPTTSMAVSEGSAAARAACSARSAGHEKLIDVLVPPPRSPPPAVAVLIAGRGFGQHSGNGMALQPGSRVRVEGLVSQPELNGVEGTVKKLLADDRVWLKLVSSPAVHTLLSTRAAPVWPRAASAPLVWSVR